MICTCGHLLKPRPGPRQICPFCRADVTKLFVSRRRGSISPITSTGPSAFASVSSLRREMAKRQIAEAESGSDWKIKKFEYKPAREVKKSGSPIKVSRRVSSHELSEIHEDLGLIFFKLPLEEDQISWRIEGNILKVKSLRLDFQYKEEIRIPLGWEDQKPAVRFLNGILIFSWEKN